jgi:aryl-alcohol dehydrogenase-like predicted oxidoreductase
MNDSKVSRREFAKAVVGTTVAATGVARAASDSPDPRKTRSYNENMEYRRLGRTNLMISAISMGGHWKKIPYKLGSEDFEKNRREVIYAALDHGINYIDACYSTEVEVYTKAVKDRRKEIYMGFDWTGARKPELAGSLDKLKEEIDLGLKKTGLDYIDILRITMREQATHNAPQEIDNVAAALDWAKKTGRARITGISTHHRPWIAEAVAKYPQFEVVVTPFSAGTKAKPVGSMFDSLKKHDVGFVGIKPFASGNVFASLGVPDSPTKAEDDERARMALRHVLACDLLSASIPGLMTVDHVKNAARAVKERRQFDMAEAARHRELAARMWRNLPPDYHWLRDWEWV